MSQAIRYQVSMEKPHSHLFEVEAAFPAVQGALTVALPVWTPGSYLVREYARHVQDLRAVGPSGEPLALHRVDKRSFRVESGGKPVRLRYRVYANELTVRTSHLDGTHGYFNGATLFFYSEALRNLPHRLEVKAPDGWEVFCSLDRDGAAFLAPDYDELIDSPVEVGPHTPLTFTAAGVPHQVVVWGDGSLDREKLVADLQRICETEARLFGGLPMKRYLFLLYLMDKGRGGLEHKGSTALMVSRSSFFGAKGWEDFLSLAAHEYFHLWNVKRIKPKALVPFDYSQESYTHLLWAFEGATSYYDNLLLRRSGLLAAPRYLTRLGETLTTLHAYPGRRVQTLSEASLISWIKHYRPDENSPNSAISYYLKGEVVAALLDLTLRQRSGDQKSLDDVMRLLWARYGDGSGVPEGGVEAAVNEVAQADLTPFFDRALRSTEELDYQVFAHVGLEVRTRVRESSNDKGGSPPRLKPPDLKPKGWLGILTRGASGIATVLEGSPALEAGLYSDDEVVALEGFRVDAAGLIARCEERSPGEVVRITVFRRDRLIEVPLALGAKPADALYLARVESPTPAQKRAYAAWLDAPWEETVAGERP